MGFYYEQALITNRQFENWSLAALPGLQTILGLQFENLVLNNREFIWQKLNIYPDEIIINNPYFQRPQLRMRGCQIDYLIQTKTNVLYLCEIKFVKQEIKFEIHINGVNEKVIEAEYFSHIVDFTEILS